MGAKRKLARRQAREDRIAAGQHPNGNKSMAKYQRAVQQMRWKAEAVSHALVHLFGHRTKRLDAYHRAMVM